MCAPGFVLAVHYVHNCVEAAKSTDQQQEAAFTLAVQLEVVAISFQCRHFGNIKFA